MTENPKASERASKQRRYWQNHDRLQGPIPKGWLRLLNDYREREGFTWPALLRRMVARELGISTDEPDDPG